MIARHGVAAVAALALLLALAPPPPLERAAQALALDRLPDVVVIVVDTLRADRLDAAIRTGAAPFLAELAASSIRFDAARSVSSWTPTAAASLFTSRFPLEHQVRTGLLAVHRTEHPRLGPAPCRLPGDLATLPQVLRARGYRTFGLSDNVNIGPALGFDRGFDHFEVALDHGATALTANAASLRDRLAGPRPYFLYLHLMDPHAPYRLHDDVPSRATTALGRYDGEIAHVDRALRRLSRSLEWGPGTLIVFTSDHGEEFREHGGRGHANKLYDELLRVPLMFRFETRLQPERRGEASVLDVLPTLRGLLGLPADPGDRGYDLLSRSAPRARWHFARRWSESVSPTIEKAAIVSDGVKLIRTRPSGLVELYDLERDPGERHDLARSRPTLRDRLLHRLARHEHDLTRPVAPRSPVALPADLAAKLRALGYGN